MGKLTKHEVEEAVPDGTFPRTLRQLRWDKIVNIVEHLPSDLRDLIQRAAVEKRRGKLRKRGIWKKRHKKRVSVVDLDRESSGVARESE